MKKRALISVSNKDGIVELAKALVDLNYEIISTGGTKEILTKANLKVTGISEITNFPEICDGRVKTLHPSVHGALLALRDNQEHLAQLKINNIGFIDIVVVNLYPFKETINKPNVSLSEAIENIDIGGPSMLRSAAKNNKFVSVVCDSLDYPLLIKELQELGNTTFKTRSALAAKAFRHTANYDAMIADYLSAEDFTFNKSINMELKEQLRYGENPHQKAALYATKKTTYSLVDCDIIQGKQLSYNNINDGNATLQLLKEFDEACVVAVKHKNPSGVGIGDNIEQAWDRAYNSDPISIFGGIIASNREITEAVARKMSEIFLEVIMAPSYTLEALEIFSKKKNLRIIKVNIADDQTKQLEYLSVNGGMLVQEVDDYHIKDSDLKIVSKTQPTSQQIQQLLFANKIVKHTKSNAIVLVKDNQTVGVGCGQTSRIGAAKIALEWAKENQHTEDLILASDAFFPFADVVELAHQYGVKAIIQPGGSIRDQESIDKCNELKIAMVFTNHRHFKH
ncbi:MAG: bifunctional phosphoribosylaminoimidazolecarboxamide formyltransferase/IMP cyclohydrolase [Erysipelotrichaceae bacterium]